MCAVVYIMIALELSAVKCETRLYLLLETQTSAHDPYYGEVTTAN